MDGLIQIHHRELKRARANLVQYTSFDAIFERRRGAPLTLARPGGYDQVIPATTQGSTMRTREAMTISLPPEMLKEVERVRKLEHRTRSERMREALRLYFNPELAARIARLPVYTPKRATSRSSTEPTLLAVRRRAPYVAVENLPM